MSNRIYTIYNNVDDFIIFTGTEEQFINFVRRIVEENEDWIIIFNINDAIEYIDKYCDNLMLVE
jgi:hypothetical protein